MDDVYWERSAFDGAPETIIFSVPRRQYMTAHVLCAVENDPKKAPVFTTRLTRYCPRPAGATPWRTRWSRYRNRGRHRARRPFGWERGGGRAGGPDRRAAALSRLDPIADRRNPDLLTGR